MRQDTKAWKRLPLAERKAILEHERRLRGLGCIVTSSKHNLTLHHCHSGSMSDEGIAVGGGQRASDWLQIPLVSKLHVMGGEAIDGSIGVKTWESIHGRQFDHLVTVSRMLGYSVFEKAGIQGISID